MKKLIYEGKSYYYKILCDVSEWGESSETIFYSPEYEKEYKKKYYFFGPVKCIKKRKELFILPFSIEDPGFTKDFVREQIGKKVQLINRAYEIKNGQII